MKKERPTPLVGQIWRDRDKRMCSGNRRVKVTAVFNGSVLYQQVVGEHDDEIERVFRAKVDRFQRAFDLL